MVTERWRSLHSTVNYRIFWKEEGKKKRKERKEEPGMVVHAFSSGFMAHACNPALERLWREVWWVWGSLDYGMRLCGDLNELLSTILWHWNTWSPVGEYLGGIRRCGLAKGNEGGLWGFRRLPAFWERLSVSQLPVCGPSYELSSAVSRSAVACGLPSPLSHQGL